VKRLGVIGTLVYDRIWHPTRTSGDPVEQWGGIAYSLAALSASRPADWTIVPILRLGSDLADPALDFLRTLPGIEAGPGIVVVPEPNNRVELRYRDGANRQERLTGGVSTWPRSAIEPLLRDLDALYVNFISGFEIEPQTAQGLQDLPIPTYADLHSLFLGPPLLDPRRNEARLPCRPTAWRQWIASFDAIQLNEAEMALLDMGGLEADARFEALPALGPAMAVVTRGGLGVEAVIDESAGDVTQWATRRGARRDVGPGPIRRVRVAVPTGETHGDPTGCGDVWGGVAFMGLLRGLAPENAMRAANVAAAARLPVDRIEGLQDTLATALGGGEAEA
jgi:hypothetical protein